MAKLRHEINLLNGTLAPSSVASEQNAFTPSNYSGSLSVYFEALASSTTSSGILSLTDGTTTFAQLTFSVSAYTLIRTGPITQPTTNIYVSSGANVTTRAARLIIIQDTGADKLRRCETQIEIGSRSSVTAASIPTGASASNQQNPKYWYYDAAKWDNVTNVYFDSCCTTPTSKSAATIQLQVADGTGNGFTGWANVTNGSFSTTQTIPNRSRAGPITLVSGRWYRVVSMTPTSKSAMNVYAAKIVIQQAGAASQTMWAQAVGGTTTALAGVGSNQILAQNFTVGASDIFVTSVIVGALNGSSGATDRAYVEIVASQGAAPPTFPWTVLATSAPTPGAGNYNNISLALNTPVTLAANTVYWFFVERQIAYPGGFDQWTVGMSSSDVISGQVWIYNSSNQSAPYWMGNFSANDLTFSLIGYPVSDSGVSKLQEQYLILNTLVATGTALQTQRMNWDSSEWSGVANTYKLEVNAANASTSAMQLRTADDVTLVATVTSPNNAGSGPATMP